MGKTSLALLLTVILGTVLLVLLVHPSRAQVSSASLTQYGSSVGEHAATAREGFENSRGGEPGAAAEGSSHSGYPERDAARATPSGSSSGVEDSLDELSQNEVAVAETPERASEVKPIRLPETGGPGVSFLLWAGISLLMIGPGARVIRGADR